MVLLFLILFKHLPRLQYAYENMPITYCEFVFEVKLTADRTNFISNLTR